MSLFPTFITRPALLAGALALTLTIPTAASAKPHKAHHKAHHKARAHAAQACENGDLAPTPANLDEIEHATLCLLNVERTTRGLRPLRSHPSLANAAARYSKQMVDDNFFDHVSPGGSTMVDRIRRTTYLKGAQAWALGENIAWGTGDLATPAKTVKAWMNSAGHRRNILDRTFREIGVGVAHGAPADGSGADTAATYTTDFGYRDR